MKSWKSILISLMAICLVLFSSNGFAKETLVYGTTEKVIDMDPGKAYDFHTWEIFYNIYEGLMKYKLGSTELEPGLLNPMQSVQMGKNTRSNFAKD